jgi:hypothetical protein
MHYASFLIQNIYPSSKFLLGFMASLLVWSSVHKTHDGITTRKKAQFCDGFNRTLPKQDQQWMAFQGKVAVLNDVDSVSKVWASRELNQKN